MADHHGAGHPEQGRRPGRAAAGGGHGQGERALDALEQDVAGEAVGDHDVGRVPRETSCPSTGPT